MTNQKQEVDAASVGIQSQRDTNVIIQGGLTYTDAKQIAEDVFRQNIEKFSSIARDTADKRASVVTEKFLQKLQKENPSGIENAIDPGFQYDLFQVQKEFAKSGDEDLGELLVDLLVDRSKTKQRDILQIVLSESLNTAPKITNNQLAVLTIVFIMRYTQNLNLGNQDLLGNYFDTYIKPFVENLDVSEASYQHLQFAGCGSLQITQISLEAIFRKTYAGLFQKGFDGSLIEGIPVEVFKNFCMISFYDKKKLQIAALNDQILAKKLEESSFDQDYKNRIWNLFINDNIKTEEEIRQVCISIRPYMEDFFRLWSASSMKNFDLTSVGIALAHSNIRRYVGQFSDLKIWIN